MIFLILLYVAQVFITSVFPFDLPDTIRNYKVIRESSPTVIYFGDSVMRTVHPQDRDKRPIYLMLQKNLPDDLVASIDQMAYHPGIYEAYVRNIAQSRFKELKYVIVPINLRTFSPEWDKRPQYQFEKEKWLLSYEYTPLYSFLHFLFSIRAINLEPISDVSFLQTPIYLGEKQVGIVSDFENYSYKEFSEENFRKKAIYYYLYDLHSEHRKLQSLINIAHILHEKNIEVVFYITPIDIESGEKILPNQFKKQVITNASTIVNEIENEGFTVLNLVDALLADAFHWNVYINEHLNMKGRIFVAEKIAEDISRFRKESEIQK